MDFLKINMTRILLTMSFLITVTSCATTFYVAPLQADCEVVGPQKCFLVRRSPNENWIMLYSPINGFDYEPGFSYRIKVQRKRVKHPPADGSKYEYVLLEELEKKDVTSDIVPTDLTGRDWKLEYMRCDNVAYLVEDAVPFIRFEEDGKVNGFAGCNNFFGSYTLEGRTLRIGEVGTNRKMCAETMDLEKAFLKMLSMELRALFDNGKLILSSNDGNRMILYLER